MILLSATGCCPHISIWEIIQSPSATTVILLPPRVREVTGGYLDEHNPLKEWLTENYIITHWEGDTVPATEMRADFLATQAAGNTVSAVKFKELMGYNGIEAKRNNRGIVFNGIKKKSDGISIIN